MPKIIEDRYIGDGVYASFDGYHIILDLRAQDKTTRIALEPDILRKIIQFSEDIKKKGQEAEKERNNDFTSI